MDSITKEKKEKKTTRRVRGRMLIQAEKSPRLDDGQKMETAHFRVACITSKTEKPGRDFDNHYDDDKLLGLGR